MFLCTSMSPTRLLMVEWPIGIFLWRDGLRVLTTGHLQEEVKKEAMDGKHRNRLITEYVYSRMEKHMHQWFWRRFAMTGVRPAFAISTWDDKLLQDYVRQTPVEQLMRDATQAGERTRVSANGPE